MAAAVSQNSLAQYLRGSLGKRVPYRVRLYVLLGLAMLAVQFLLVCQIWYGYMEDIKAAETTTRNFVSILEARLEATLRRADSDLQALSQQITPEILSQSVRSSHAARINATLDNHLINFEELAGMRIFDANGDLLYTSDSARVPDTNNSDRRYFMALRDNPKAGLVFSEVVISRSTGRPSLVAARALRDESGTFRGVVMAVIEVAYFQKLFQTLDVGQQGLIVIRRSDDFSQVVRWPPMDSANNITLPLGHPSRAILAAGKKEATFETNASSDGILRIFSIRRLDKYPFYIQVALAREDVLAGWKIRSLIIAGSGLLLLGLVAGLLVWFRRMELREMQVIEALRESREQLGMQFELMPVGCIVVDRDLVLLSWNPAAERIFGYSAAEAVGRNVSQLIVPPDVQPEVKAVWQKLAAGQQVVHSINNNITKDGTLITCEWLNTPFRGPDGQMSGVLSMVQDITKRLEHEKELLKMEKLESLGVLAGGIAHDFNNILTGIVGNVSFAQLLLETGHRARKPLQEAEKASQRAGELARQLLTFARGGEPVKKAISVERVIKEALSLMLRGSNVRGETSFADSLQLIEADEGQINQVFNNIILNAAQAMPDGGTLSVRAVNDTVPDSGPLPLAAGNYLKITFSDQGGGIAQDDLQRIFDPYFSTKSSGTGLGLASAHSIVLRHGGAITVSSVVGQGTCFTVYLPSTSGALPEQLLEQYQPPLAAYPGRSILVMDDEPMILELTAEMLKHLGYQASTCQDGGEAVKLYKAAFEAGHPFSAVIMDLTVPGGMGGKEAARQMLAINPQACLIVSSGYSSDPIMSDYRSYGFSGAVAKPYSAMQFGQMLGSLLDGASL